MIAAKPLLALALLLLVTPCFAGTVDDLLMVGKKAFGDSQYSLAITSFQRILNEYPDSALVEEAQYLLGVSLFYVGNWSESLDTLTAFRAHFTDSVLAPRASYWIGAASLKLGNYQAALDTLLSVSGEQDAANPYGLNSALLSGVALEGLGRDADAAVMYRKVLADPAGAPLSAEATYRLAGTELRAGRYAPARDLYGKVLIDAARSPFVQDSLFYLAECELSLGNLVEAEKRYRTLLSLYPIRPTGRQRPTGLPRLHGARGRGLRRSTSSIRCRSSIRRVPIRAAASACARISAWNRGNTTMRPPVTWRQSGF